MWRRHLVEGHHPWQLGIQQFPLRSVDGIAVRLGALLKNLQRRTPPSVFAPKDRTRLLYVSRARVSSYFAKQCTASPTTNRVFQVPFAAHRHVGGRRSAKFR